MLISLHVKNLALIEETEVFFGRGLNILTGETGAGKSIIIGSVNLALGAKADRELIRTGKDYALIELVFQMDRESQKKKLKEMDISPEDEDLLVITRRIMPGKSLCKVNGETVSARQLKELSEVLIDIHGQHEHQSLLYKKKHLEILDSFGGASLAALKTKLKDAYHFYRALERELAEAADRNNDKDREISMAEFEAAEIGEANLIPGEDEELEHAYRRMANARKILEAVGAAYAMTGGESGDSAGERTGRALRELNLVSEYDGALEELAGQLEEIDDLLSDFNRSLSVYLSEMEFSEEDFRQTEERLNLVNHLKSKYGQTIGEILSYREKRQEEIDRLHNYEAYIQGLRQRLESAWESLMSLCAKVSDKRKKCAAKLEKQMTDALRDLNFDQVKFSIKVEGMEQSVGAGGYDDVEFLISTNPGEPVKPLGSVASGGELSRIMLALKTVLAGEDEIDTLIFDEIDAGISGKTAWQVSKKLAVLGGGHQIICITHLPQIAAMADSHFKIEKKILKEHTVTEISSLDEKESIRELARLLGGDSVTEAALKNASEMKELAANTKLY